MVEGTSYTGRDHVIYLQLFALTKKQRETGRNKKGPNDALMNCDTYWRNTLSQYIDVYNEKEEATSYISLVISSFLFWQRLSFLERGKAIPKQNKTRESVYSFVDPETT